jgi:ubiquinone/menaquinone biosynthesis C-methylase UbiE
MVTDSQQYYSRREVAQNYDSERFLTPGGQMFDLFEKSVVLSYLPQSPKGVKVLDAGAGSGRFTIEIAEKGFDVVSCDYSEAMLEIIRSKITALNLTKRVLLSRQDITQMTFEDNEFDYICSLRVMVNLDTVENEVRALNELVRVCRPGGKVVVEFVNSLSIAGIDSKKESMVSMSVVKDILSKIPNAKLEAAFGRRIISQTAFEKSPNYMLKALDIIDSGLSKLFPYLCVRTYYVIVKQ